MAAPTRRRPVTAAPGFALATTLSLLLSTASACPQAPQRCQCIDSSSLRCVDLDSTALSQLKASLTKPITRLHLVNCTAPSSVWRQFLRFSNSIDRLQLEQCANLSTTIDAGSTLRHLSIRNPQQQPATINHLRILQSDRLEHIECSQCRIGSLKALQLSSTARLRSIRLDGNAVEAIDRSDWSRRFGNVRALSLRRNRLRRLPAAALASLQTLDVSDNRIRSVDARDAAILGRVNVRLRGNPLVCTELDDGFVCKWRNGNGAAERCWSAADGGWIELRRYAERSCDLRDRRARRQLEGQLQPLRSRLRIVASNDSTSSSTRVATAPIPQRLLDYYLDSLNASSSSSSTTTTTAAPPPNTSTSTDSKSQPIDVTSLAALTLACGLLAGLMIALAWERRKQHLIRRTMRAGGDVDSRRAVFTISSSAESLRTPPSYSDVMKSDGLPSYEEWSLSNSLDLDDVLEARRGGSTDDVIEDAQAIGDVDAAADEEVVADVDEEEASRSAAATVVDVVASSGDVIEADVSSKDVGD